MKNSIFLSTPILLFLMWACGSQTDQLKIQVDSLENELQAREKLMSTLQEMSVIMDSIDDRRNLLRLDLKEGITHENYVNRMMDIENHIRNSEQKISELERSLRRVKGNASAYRTAMRRLKTEIERKNAEVQRLNTLVANLDDQNRSLISTIDLQETELIEKNRQLITKEQELDLIEARIQELLIKSKVSEAESYFTRGLAVEEAANRTRLAPRKKKETYREALELYRKALSLGKEEAQEKIQYLKKKID